MTSFRFVQIEPGISYEYAVLTPAGARIGRVRHEISIATKNGRVVDIDTGRWIADNGREQAGGLKTRDAAAGWLASWR